MERFLFFMYEFFIMYEQSVLRRRVRSGLGRGEGGKHHTVSVSKVTRRHAQKPSSDWKTLPDARESDLDLSPS